MKAIMLPLWYLCDFATQYKGIDKHMQTNVLKIRQCTAQQAKEFDVDGGDIKVYTAGTAIYHTTKEIAGDYVCHIPDAIGIGNALSNDTVKMFETPFVSANNHIAVVRDKDIILPKMLYNILKYASRIENYFRGTTLKTACMDEMLKMEIPVPQMQFQVEIVKWLDEIDSNMESIKAQIGALDMNINELINFKFK